MKQKICTCIFTCYALTKSFNEKPNSRVACVKEKEFDAKSKAF
jgi:hypothetical protein